MTKKEEVEKMEKFVISKNKNGEFKFDFIDKKNKVLLSSGSYTRKAMCKHGIESVKKNAQDESNFKCKSCPNEQLYFNLKSFNGKIIGVSQLFADKDSRDSIIEYIKSKAPSAVMVDRSITV